MKKRSGFTLIELSIVLVIIGLIVGGVLVGQDLIRAAQMRSIQSDFSKFETARNTFLLKYNCFPGDCDKATTFGLGTNGNGDKAINHYSNNNEVWQFWAHLAKSGLINGEYTGLPESGIDDRHATKGINVPEAPLGAAYGIYSNWMGGGSNTDLKDERIVTGKDTSTGDYGTFGGHFKVIDVQLFDTKYDDGFAATGTIQVGNDFAGHDVDCVSGTGDARVYDLSSSGLCYIAYYYADKY